MDYIESIDEDVKKMIKSVGYEIIDADLFLLEQSIDKVKFYILNKNNQNKVPVGLKYVWINRSVAEFLNFKKALGKLNINGLNFGRIAKEIGEGDTKVVFDNTKTTGDKFEVFLGELMTYGEDEILKYRRLVW